MIRIEDLEARIKEMNGGVLEEREGNPLVGLMYGAGISLVLWLVILYVACGGVS